MWRGRFGHQFLSPALGARTAAGGEFEGTQFDAWSWLPMELKNMGKPWANGNFMGFHEDSMVI